MNRLNVGIIRRRLKPQAGLTLLETLIAAFILLFMLLSMVSAYNFGRLNLDREEVKRKATALALDRLEQVKARYARERLDQPQFAWEEGIEPAMIDTTYVVDGTTFILTSVITCPLAPCDDGTLKNVEVTVSWTAKKNNNTAVTRTVAASTSIARVIGIGG
jgi:hypothetical protein